MPTFATFSGTYGVDGTGHGTATLVIPGFDGGTFNFALYAISANEYFCAIDRSGERRQSYFCRNVRGTNWIAFPDLFLQRSVYL